METCRNGIRRSPTAEFWAISRVAVPLIFKNSANLQCFRVIVADADQYTILLPRSMEEWITVSGLRKFLRGCFAYTSVIFLIAAFGTVSTLFRGYGAPDQPRRQLTFIEILLLGMSKLVLLLPLLLAYVNGMAWWNLRNRKPSGRLWALAASFGILLAGIALFGMDLFTSMYASSHHITVHGSRHAPHFTVLIVAHLAIGIAGLVTFWPRDAHLDTTTTLPARVSRDGTHAALDLIALILQIGGTFWGISIYERWGYYNGLPHTHGLESWFQWIIVVMCVILIHESAHALTGIALGMKLRAFVVGPFQWRLLRGQWTFRFQPAQLFALSGAAGLVSPDPDRSPWEEVAMIAAGPFSNLITGAVAAALTYSARDEQWGQLWEYFALFATISLVAFVVNLIPFRPDALYSDGARIYQLFRRGPVTEYHRALKIAQSTLVSQRRPRDYDIAAIHRASAHFTDGLEGLILRLFATSCYFDRGDYAEASTALTEAESVYSQSANDIPAELHTGFIIKGTILHREGDYARRWWDLMEAKKPKILDQDYWLAKCAVHLSENDVIAAHNAWDTGHAYLQKLPDAGTYNYDRYCYSKIKGLLENQSDTAGIAPRAATNPVRSNLLPAAIE